ncbi:MAG TPA: FAD-dependent thymidylate synthase, partial [Turneriella sp.]|nr:FAD-dependent thymidylate synthase [Turneriella sp.]
AWYALPLSLSQRVDVHAYHEKVFAAYQALIETLKPTVEEIYFSIHKLKARNKEAWASDIQKRCMEVARYVMPVSTVAYLYHSVSALTLMRYARMLLWSGYEEFIVLGIKMFELIQAVDADLFQEFPEPLKPPTRVYDTHAALQKNKAFDASLENRPAKLISSSLNAIRHLDTAFLKQALSPGENTLLGDVFYPGTLDETSRLLNHAHFTFLKKLSHTADSQEQRHRTLPGNRPHLAEQISLEEDFIEPKLLGESTAAQKIYRSILAENFELLRTLWKEESIPREDITYLVPNAFPVRFMESGDLYNFYHKWKARLCYNAQEEIFHSAYAEVDAVRKLWPDLGKFLGPPCFVREFLKPRCPEGDHFCGIKVWQLPFEEYNRVI